MISIALRASRPSTIGGRSSLMAFTMSADLGLVAVRADRHRIGGAAAGVGSLRHEVFLALDVPEDHVAVLDDDRALLAANLQPRGLALVAEVHASIRAERAVGESQAGDGRVLDLDALPNQGVRVAEYATRPGPSPTAADRRSGWPGSSAPRRRRTPTCRARWRNRSSPGSGAT